MSSVSELQKKIYELTSGLFATWLPDDRLDIGDYGKLDKGRFLRDGNLKRKGILFEEEVVTSESSAFRYSDGAKIKTGASAGTAAALAGGEVAGEIEFSRKGGFIYHIHDAKQVRLENRGDFLRSLLQAVVTGQIQWKEGDVVVDEVRQCGRYWIMISEMKSGSVKLNGSVKVAEGSNLASLRGGVSPAVELGSVLDYSNGKMGRPLYHAIKPVFDGGPSGGSGLRAFLRYFRSVIGHRYPEPNEIDITAYKGTPDTFVVQAKNARVEERGFSVKFEAATIDDLLRESDAAVRTDDSHSAEAVQVNQYGGREREAGQ